jgi:hypothetical protein
MSSIPAPNIFADAQQISNNPLEEYSRAQQLQSQAQGIQQQKIQTQSQQLELQDQQNAHTLGPQFLQKDANGKITGFDNEGYYNALIGSGMNPAKVMGMRQQNLTYQTGIAKLGSDQVDLQNKKNDDIYGMVEPLRQAAQDSNADVNHINAVWQGIAPKLAQLGIDPKTMPASFQSAQDAASRLQDMDIEAGQHKQMLADVKTQAETAAANAKAASDTAEAGKATAETGWQKFPELGMMYNTATKETRSMTGGAMMTPGMMEAKYVGLQQKKNSGQSLSSDDAAFAKGYEKFKTLVPAFNIAMNATGGGLGPGAAGAGGAAGTGGGANAAQLSINDVPAAIRGRVQAALDYRQALPPQGRNNPINSAISEWAYKLDPQHDETNFPARNKLMTSFTSGKESQQINAVNTAMGHIGVLSDAVDALNNTNVPILNAIANKVGVAVGNTPATTMQTIVHRVGPELAAAYIQGGGGEGERGTTADDFSINKGADQLKANLGVTAQLLRSKIGSLQNQYTQTMSRNDFQQRFITPEAQQTLNKLSPQGAQGGGQHVAGGSSNGLKEGQTGTGSDGKKYVVKNGTWVAQ